MVYEPRLIDSVLDELLPELAAVALEGAKGVGKTATAARRCQSVLALDQTAVGRVVSAHPELILREKRPVLLDEWQRVPEVWDVVRRAVDRDSSGAQFLLTGSASAGAAIRLHSGAGRIVRIHLRPLALCERGLTRPTVSLAALLTGGHQPVEGSCPLTLTDYTREVLASGLPGIRGLTERARATQLDSYIDRALDQDLTEIGVAVRRPRAMRSWLTAYAAATSSTAAHSAILNAATAGDGEKPNRQTVGVYREALERIWLLDPIPAWSPTFSHLRRIAQSPKHQVLDPALAARLLGATESSLLRGEGETVGPRDGTLLGALFESLAALTVRAISSSIDAIVGHLRTRNGDHEVDLIVERPDGRVVAIEVKLSASVVDRDVRHLSWLKSQIGDRLIDSMVINTGPYAYRRPDGIAVVPLGLLGA